MSQTEWWFRPGTGDASASAKLQSSEMLNFYRLRELPFGVAPDPRYLFLSRSHRQALESLGMGIESERGFFQLVADPGLGKTTILYELMQRFEASAKTVFLFQTQCTSREFFRYVLSSLNIDTRGLDVVDMHEKLNQVLAREMLADKSFVLIVDEAQNLDESVLETVRLLSNFETPSRKLIQIILSGQPELMLKLAHPSLAQLKQRISVSCRLEPLTADEVGGYIQHRLQVAGYGGGKLFTPEALATLAAVSKGVPRAINDVCFHSLISGYSLSRNQIDDSIVRKAAAEMGRPAIGKKIVTPPHRPSIFSLPQLRTNPLAGPLSYSSKTRPSHPGRHVAAGLAFAAVMILAGLFWPSTTGDVNPHATAPSITSSTPNSAAPQTGSSALPAATEESAPTAITVVVQSGDTLQSICMKYVGRYDEALLREIFELNPQLKNSDHIEIGQSIWLPVKPGGVNPATSGSAGHD
ncbi:MAG: AAA family ATPase [Candidatus Acidiferrales bacterium]